jgi:hypothetical protein
MRERGSSAVPLHDFFLLMEDDRRPGGRLHGSAFRASPSDRGRCFGPLSPSNATFFLQHSGAYPRTYRSHEAALVCATTRRSPGSTPEGVFPIPSHDNGFIFAGSYFTLCSMLMIFSWRTSAFPSLILDSCSRPQLAHLRCLGGRNGLAGNPIPGSSMPGLAMSGFSTASPTKAQLFGRGENAYLSKLHQENRTDPSSAFSTIHPLLHLHPHLALRNLFRHSRERRLHISRSDFGSREFYSRLRGHSRTFRRPHHRPRVMVVVFGLGTSSWGLGLGKSETRSN